MEEKIEEKMEFEKSFYFLLRRLGACETEANNYGALTITSAFRIGSRSRYTNLWAIRVFWALKVISLKEKDIYLRANGARQWAIMRKHVEAAEKAFTKWQKGKLKLRGVL